MLYNEFGRAIGLMTEDEEWNIRYRQPITDILCIIAAVEDQAGGTTSFPLEHPPLVNSHGEPGPGFFKTSRIVSAGE
jgi:hypothetical protein